MSLVSYELGDLRRMHGRVEYRGIATCIMMHFLRLLVAFVAVFACGRNNVAFVAVFFNQFAKLKSFCVFSPLGVLKSC